MRKPKTLAQKQQRAKIKREHKRHARDLHSRRKQKLRRIINVIDAGHLAGVEGSPLLKANYVYVLKELQNNILMTQNRITS